MNLRRTCASILLLIEAACSSSGPPYSPEESLSQIELPAGYRIELVAAEPDVVDPVAIAFDERVRMYVVEMIDYPLDLEPLGRIKLLEDRDGDGYYETGSVFAEEIQFPNGVMRWRDGILVTSAPDILYFEDTDGDGKADKREVVLTGFAATNPQLRVNGLRYGVDNWIYANYPRVINPRKFVKEFGDPGEPLHFPGKPDAPALDIRAVDIRFRPGEGRVEPLGGVSQYGDSFDRWGNRFTVWNNDYLRHLVIESRYLEGNPYLAVEKAYQSVSGLDHSAELYPITVDPLVIHDSQVGHFTSACGMSIYTGGVFSKDFEDNALTCEPVHNLIRRSILTADGATFLAKPAYENKEFIASKDSWFRPVFTTTGPDGALYIADYYRFTVEHPEFVPPELSKQIEFEARHRLGRIYRVVHEESQLWPPVDLAEASTAELVENLAHSNLWRRIESQRLLVDRQGSSAVEPLRKLAAEPSSPVARIHALWTLDGLGAADDALVLAALQDPHPEVRRQAILLSETRLPNAALAEALLAMRGEQNARVEFQLALTLGLPESGIPTEATFPILRQIAQRHIEDEWFRIGALTAAAENSDQWFASFVEKAEFREQPSPGKRDMLERIAAIIGARQRQPELAAALRSVAKASAREDSWWRIASLAGLAQGVEQSRGGAFRLGAAEPVLVGLLAKADPEVGQAALELAWRANLGDSAALRRLVAEKAKVAQDAAAPVADRAYAAGLLGLGPGGRATGELAGLLSPQHPAEVQLAAAKALTFAAGSAAGDQFLGHWRELSSPVREVALDWFFNQRERIQVLLDAVENGEVQPWSLGPAKTRVLARHPDSEIQQRAKVLLASAEGEGRQAVYEEYLPALQKEGEARRGRGIFEEHCAQCHKVGETGFDVGPDLLAVTTRYKEVLLADILMPNQAVETGYEEYMVNTNDGRMITGVIAKETPASVTIRRAQGEEDTVLRSNVKSMYSLSVSPMPEGFEDEIDVEGMADLIAYIKSLRG